MKNYLQRVPLFFLRYYRLLIRAILAVLGCLIVLASLWQFWVIPRINAYEGWLRVKLEQAIGHPISIGELQAGWRGVRPYLRFNDFRIYNSSAVPSLHLPQIEARLSWWHLLVGQVYFSRIQLASPTLSIHRDAQHVIWIAGIPLRPESRQDNSQWLNWFWQQGGIDVNGGVLTWQDDTQQTEPLVLNKVDLRVSRLFSRHQLKVQFSSPQQGLITPIVIHSVLYGQDVQHIDAWQGEVSVAGFRADFAKLWQYIPAAAQPFALHSANGEMSALQLEFDTFKNWQVRLQAKLDNIYARYADFPPLKTRSLNLALRFNNTSGEVRLGAEALHLDYPQQFVEPIHLHTAQLKGKWHQAGADWHIDVADLAASNPDITLQLKGKYHSRAANKDWFTVQGKVKHARANRVYAYLPRELGDRVLEWLKEALRAGEAFDTTIKIEGKVKDFPFADGEPGRFEVDGKARDVVMVYAPGWPQIVGITGSLHFSKRGMVLHVARAQTNEADLYAVQATMADMKNDEHLRIVGQANGETQNFLQFVKQSPLRFILSQGADKAKIAGKGELALNLAIPLSIPQKTTVQGALHFTDNQFDFGPAVPLLQNAAGNMSFTERDVAVEMRAKALGGMVHGEGKTDKAGVLTVNMTGQAHMLPVIKQYMPEMGRVLSGTTAYRAQLKLASTGYTLDLTSDLSGVAIRLPDTLAKTNAEQKPFTLHFRQESLDKQQLTFNYAQHVTGALSWSKPLLCPHGNVIVNPDSTAAAKFRKGVWLIGQLDTVNWSAWQPLWVDKGHKGACGLQGVDLRINQLLGYGYQLKEVAVHAQQQARGWSGKFTADNAAGEFSLHNAPSPLAKIQLNKLYWPLSSAANKPINKEQSNGSAVDPTVFQRSDLPTVIADITDFRYEGRALGQVHAHVTPLPQAWKVNRIAVKNNDGEFFIHGLWRYVPGHAFTQAEVEIKSQNVEGLLQRFKQKELIRGGNAHIQGSLQWRGHPFAIDYASLEGKLAVTAKKGQFAKIDPGASRLLSIFSLQALPRRITLDFRDIFSKGLAFDRVEGNAHIQQGIVHTDNLLISGPAAQILFRGDIDMLRQKQNLTVRVAPIVGDGVALAAGVLVNPLVGVGTFVLQRVLKDPLGQLVVYDYTMTGTWQDPVINKVTKPLNPKDKNDHGRR